MMDMAIVVLLRSLSQLPLRRVVLVAALSVPLDRNFLYGQYYVSLLLVLTLACWCYVHQKRFLSGLRIGPGFGLKLFPILYLGYFLRKRDFDLPPEISSTNNWSFSVIDLDRETEPKFVGDFGLRGSVCAGLTGRIAVSVAQVSASSNRVEELLFFPKIPAVAVR